MRMVLKDGKLKVLTLSYDDGVYQDIRLVEIMEKFGLKGTFNINSGRVFPEDGVREKQSGRLKLSEAVELYKKSGNELAVHGMTHPFLDKLDSTEIITEIIEDRKALEEASGQIIRGMAYPFGTYNDLVVDVLDKCGIAYSRTVKPTLNFKFPENWLTLHPTCHHKHEKMEELIKSFVENPSRWNNAEMFYLWGHSYEFDNDDNWDLIENFGKIAGGHDHIWYATNIEIYDYVKAYESLKTSCDKKIVYNPSVIEVWFEHNGDVYSVKPGETVRL